MSDDRRFDATPARRRRARREGNVPRSAEVSSLIAFAAALAAATLAVPAAVVVAAAAIQRTIAVSFAHAGATAPAAAAGPMRSLVAAALAPACAAAVAGAAAALAQGGGLHAAPVRADPKRLDPIAGLKRIAGGGAVIGALRAVCAFVAATAAIVPAARDAIASARTAVAPASTAALIGAGALRACIAAAAVASAFALVDIVLTRRRWLRSLRMSFDELKRDAKENDGDPHARARRKSAHRTVLRGGVSRTREASFVVVNPTHVAIAMRYTPPVVPVPEIVVRAADDAALRVRTIALASGVPVIEDVALARALYAQGEAGRAIPPELYVAVAQVVASLARARLLA